ncbi:MAG TPA: NAD(P)-dependent oxidoreductase [Stellaceae bacterium]|nr:NAD(P)-dependent oxidoreductase [Stellaceae bacterium]
MDYFPVFLDLRGRRALVVGAGAAADAKAAALARAGADVHLTQSFAPTMLDDAALVFVAGARLALAEQVARAAEARGIWVNVMDEPRLCSFLMPALVERGPVTVAIGTSGTAPMLARLLREWLDLALPLRLGALASLAGRFRPLVRRRLPDLPTRRRFWHRIFTGKVAQRALDGDEAAARAALLAALDETQAAATDHDKAA